jgi:rod shape determining protein RodA
MMKKFFNFIGCYFRKSDQLFWIISAIISCYGLLLLSSVSRMGGSYFNTQLITVTVGFVSAFLLSDFDYRIIAKYWFIPSAFCMILMFLTLVIGTGIEGSAGVNARAWIKLPGNITFQPSELAKICFIITFSKHLYTLKQKEKLKSFVQIIILAMHALVPILFTHIQGDDGAAIIFLFMFLFMSFAAGIQLRYFFMMFGVMLAAIPILWKYVLEEYQIKRILSQLNPESDPQRLGFQQIQGKISIGSGKIFGTGLFQGPRIKKGSVPIQASDFIFSAAGEELGFIGCVLILVLIMALLFRCLYISRISSDALGSYICFGFFGLVFTQTIFNLGMCLSLMPVIGVTLPFFSAGGSSAVCLYLGLGLVQSVFSKKQDKRLEDNPDFIQKKDETLNGRLEVIKPASAGKKF